MESEQDKEARKTEFAVFGIENLAERLRMSGRDIVAELNKTMIVYHGSTDVISNPLAHIGRNHLDFGKGFYVTNLQQQAVSWAMRPANDGKKKYLNIYDFNLDQALLSGKSILTFQQYNRAWLDFVVSNRKGGTEWQKYDIIQGGIANDRVFNTVELYAADLITAEEALKRLSYHRPNNQICITSQSVIDQYLTYKESTEISSL